MLPSCSTTLARAALMLVAQASLVVAVAQSPRPPESAADPQAQALLDRAVRQYRAFNIEAALPLLRDLLSPSSRRLTKAQELKAHQYLGASFALTAMRDSALGHFRTALLLDPGLELDRNEFGDSETAVFAEAKRGVTGDPTRPAANSSGAARTRTLMIGTRTPGAQLFIDGESRGPLSPLLSISVPAGRPVRVSIRADKCTPWDTTLVMGGDTTRIVLGRKQLRCT